MLILIGKSGSGKTAVVNELVKRGSWKKAVTYTTRPIRPGEVNGVTTTSFHRKSSTD